MEKKTKKKKNYVIYEGYVGHPMKVLKTGKGSWLKHALQLSNMDKSYYCIGTIIGDEVHWDFGSHTIFVKEDNFDFENDIKKD